MGSANLGSDGCKPRPMQVQRRRRRQLHALPWRHLEQRDLRTGRRGVPGVRGRGGVINKSQWYKAAKKDKEYISEYAKQYPKSEDVAESIVAWIAVRYRLDRISNGNAEIILKTIPNRLKCFDEQNFDMYPLVPRE